MVPLPCVLMVRSVPFVPLDVAVGSCNLYVCFSAGSIYAFSNAAMMAMQLGDEAGALRELQVWLRGASP